MKILINPERVVYEEPGVYTVAESEEFRISVEIAEDLSSIVTVDNGKGTLPIEEMHLGSAAEVEQFLEDLILQYGGFVSYDEYLNAVESEEFDGYDDSGDFLELDDRSIELEGAFEDFMDTLLYKASGKQSLIDYEDITKRIKRMLGILFYEEYGVSIYDPQFMMDDMGEYGVERYPYREFCEKKKDFIAEID